MEIRMDFPPGTGVEPITDGEGHLVGVKLIPFFTAKRAGARVALCTAKSAQDKATDEFALVVSGVTGQVKKQNRTDSVVPFCDLPADQQAGTDASTDDEDEEDDG